MTKRIISGIIGALFVVVSVVLNQTYPVLITTLVALVGILCIYEIFSAIGIWTNFAVSIPSIVFALVFPFIGQGAMVLVFLYTIYIFCTMIFLGEKVTFKDISVLYNMTLIVSFSLKSILILKDFGGTKLGSFYIILSLALPWIADTGAYFIGTFLGKHKLCPKISPKKTIEGAIGSITFGVASVFITYFVFDIILFKGQATINYISVICLGLFGSILSIFGDLSFSFIKRSCNIKDFGNVIPGHGGMLDRFDSVIFVAPLIYFFTQIFPFINV